MAIYSQDSTYILAYNEYLSEMAIADETIEKTDTFLKNFKKQRENIAKLKQLIFDLKNSLSNHDEFNLLLSEKNGQTESYIVDYLGATQKIVNDIKKFEDDSIPDKLRIKYVKLIYPENESPRFDIVIQIQKNNYNRIHIPVGLPYVLQGIGFGKKIYRKAIQKFKYISTDRFDRTLDAIAVWNSLRKNKDIYSFVRNEQMICFDDKIKYNEIEVILLNFFRHEIEEEKKGNHINTYILDDDFLEKYRYENVANSELKYLLK